jgi:nucleotide-binding universal stress UspA family protein
MKSKKIIVAVGLEPETRDPLMQLKDLDLSVDAEIHFVNIVPVILYARGMDLKVLIYPLPEERPKIEASILKQLLEIKKELLPDHENVVLKCLFDVNAKATFTDYVRECQADLVVVATRGKYGIKHFFDSSFAEHQLKHGPCNILILRRKEY